MAWYSIKDEEADIYASGIEVDGGNTVYEVIKNGKSLGMFSLSIPGSHNVLNSLPVIYLAHELGCDMETVKEKLANFKGANRRYQIIYDNGMRIIDDYAHHPTEIKVTIEAARTSEKGKLTIIFQPHRYSRTKFFFDDFVKSQEKADELIILPVYSAGEENIYGVSSDNIAEKKGKGEKICSEGEVEKIVSNGQDKEGTFIFMGAGSVSKLAHEIKEKLK